MILFPLPRWQLGHAMMLALLAMLWPWLAEAAASEKNPLVIKNGIAVITLDATWNKDDLVMSYHLVPLTLTVEGEAPLKVEIPKKWVRGKWDVFAKDPSSETTLDKGRVRWQRHYFIEPLIPGTLELQLEPIKIWEKGKERTILWKPWKVQVQIKEEDIKELRGNSGVEEVAPASATPAVWPWWLGGTLLVILLGGLWCCWRGVWRLGRTLSAEQWVDRELDRLLLLNLPDRGEVERFHTLLSNIIRRYLERHFQVKARRQTTPEFLQTMASDTRFTPAQQAVLRDFLQRCDLAKFAGVAVSGTDCQALAERGRQFAKETSLVPIHTKEIPSLQGMTWWKKALFLSIAWPVLLAFLSAILISVIWTFGSPASDMLATAELLGGAVGSLWFFGTIGIWLFLWRGKNS